MYAHRFRRSKKTAIVFLLLSVVALVFFAWALWPRPPLHTLGGRTVSLWPPLDAETAVLGLLYLGLGAFSVRQLRRCRHDIVVSAEGVFDGAVSAEPVP